MKLETKFDIGDEVVVDCGKYNGKKMSKQGVICKIQTYVSDETKQINMYSLRGISYFKYHEEKLTLVKDV